MPACVHLMAVNVAFSVFNKEEKKKKNGFNNNPMQLASYSMCVYVSLYIMLKHTVGFGEKQTVNLLLIKSSVLALLCTIMTHNKAY